MPLNEASAPASGLNPKQQKDALRAIFGVPELPVPCKRDGTPNLPAIREIDELRARLAEQSEE